MKGGTQKQQEYKQLLRLPHAKEISDKIKLANEYGIKTVFYFSNTLRSDISRTKPSTQVDTKKCILKFQYECMQLYIGEIKGTFEDWLWEHQSDTKKGEPTPSSIA